MWNNNGLNTELCGTVTSTFSQVDSYPQKLTNCFLPSRYEIISRCIFPLTPYHSNFLSKVFLSTLHHQKLYLNLKRLHKFWSASPLSKLDNTLSIKSDKTKVVEWLFESQIKNYLKLYFKKKFSRRP